MSQQDSTTIPIQIHTDVQSNNRDGATQPISSTFSLSSFTESFRRTAGLQFERRNSSAHHQQQRREGDIMSPVEPLARGNTLPGVLGRSFRQPNQFQSTYGSLQQRDVFQSPSFMDSKHPDSAPVTPDRVSDAMFTSPSSLASQYEDDPASTLPFLPLDDHIEGREYPGLFEEETDPFLPDGIQDEDPHCVVAYHSRSTFSQTVFNAVNILMGIGLLSLPFAFRITGWIVGISLLIVFCATTRYTAMTVRKCLDYPVPDHFPFRVSYTFGDFGEIAFGPAGRNFISCVFVLELFAASVALLILTSDSIVALFPHLDITIVKISTAAIVFPMTIPQSLKFASYGSLLGVLAIVNLLVIVLVDGFSTRTSPGSILVPSETHLLPPVWIQTPLALGLIMSGFCGHSVFPSIYRDMAEPKKYPAMVNVTFFITALIYTLIACAGYLMFGNQTREEISQNLPLVKDYNQVTTQITIWLVALNPITKYPLSINPVNVQIENLFNAYRKSCHPVLLRVFCRLMVTLTVLAVAVLFPGFHYVMAILGSFFSFTVSVVFPEACHLRLFSGSMTRTQKWISIGLVSIGSLLGILGTIWAFLPHLS